jgi:hypothetical protein
MGRDAFYGIRESTIGFIARSKSLKSSSASREEPLLAIVCLGNTCMIYRPTQMSGVDSLVHCFVLCSGKPPHDGTSRSAADGLQVLYNIDCSGAGMSLLVDVTGMDSGYWDESHADLDAGRIRKGRTEDVRRRLHRASPPPGFCNCSAAQRVDHLKRLVSRLTF